MFWIRTHPGAQEYLRKTYATLREWGVRFIKMDFMDDTAIEGAYFRPNTTALEAQRIASANSSAQRGRGGRRGSIRTASAMLEFRSDSWMRAVSPGHRPYLSKPRRTPPQAWRRAYYMNRNFFIADPDAFTVSTQTVDDQYLAWRTNTP